MSKIKKEKYYLYISSEVIIDLGEISDYDWFKIKKEARRIITCQDSKDPIVAYIASFSLYIQDMQILSEPYNPDFDKFN